MKDVLGLPLKIKIMVEQKIARLADWPNVPGVRALEGMRGVYRIHAGDHRVIFRIEEGGIVVEQVTDRKDVYRKKNRGRDEELVRVPRTSLKGGRNYTSDLLRWAIAKDLKAARLHAGLTQSELARRTGRTQATVSQSEQGRTQVSPGYVSDVLKACGLPDDWRAPSYPRR